MTHSDQRDIPHHLLSSSTKKKLERSFSKGSSFLGTGWALVCWQQTTALLSLGSFVVSVWLLVLGFGFVLFWRGEGRVGGEVCILSCLYLDPQIIWSFFSVSQNYDSENQKEYFNITVKFRFQNKDFNRKACSACKALNISFNVKQRINHAEFIKWFLQKGK